MASNMRYIVRGPDGKEYGPVEQDTLVQWAEAGRITSEYEVRNMLMNSWSSAKSVSFLKPLIERQIEQAQSQQKLSKIKALFNPRDGQATEKAITALHKAGNFQYTPGNTLLRFAAWLMDTLLLLLIGCGLFVAMVKRAGDGLEKAPSICILMTLLFVAIVLSYYTLLLAFSAQTVGQRFWGLMIVRTEGGPVLMGRALCFTVLHFLLGASTVVFTFVLPDKRALQDRFSGTRVVKTRVTE